MGLFYGHTLGYLWENVRTFQKSINVGGGGSQGSQVVIARPQIAAPGSAKALQYYKYLQIPGLWMCIVHDSDQFLFRDTTVLCSWYTLFEVPCSWYLVRGTLFVVPWLWYLVCGIWYLVCGTLIVLPWSWFLDLGTLFVAHRSLHFVRGTLIVLPGSWYLDRGALFVVPCWTRQFLF